jgi:succinate-acetate transporter protein
MAVAYGGITSVIKSISAWKEKSNEGFDAGADQT